MSAASKSRILRLAGDSGWRPREFYAELFALGVDGVIAGRTAVAMAALADIGG